MKKLVFSIALFCGVTANAQQLLEVLKPFPTEENTTDPDKPGSAPNFPIGQNAMCSAESRGSSLVTILDNKGRIIGQYDAPKDTYLLKSAEEANFNLPYSGRAGMDTSALAWVESGSVDGSDGVAVSHKMQELGYVLFDVSYPCSDAVTIRVGMDEVVADTNWEEWNAYWTATGG